MNSIFHNYQLRNSALNGERYLFPCVPTAVGMTGFSMVEVLVALLVLSIGLLGLAGLQASGLRYSGNSALRTQALILTQDIIERMHANTTGVSAENYEIASVAAFTSLATAPNPNCATGACTSAELASYDLIKWKQVIVQQLPAATATIDVVPSAPPGIIYTTTITINWTERQTEGASGNQSLIMEIKL